MRQENNFPSAHCPAGRSPLWSRFVETRNDDVRTELVNAYLPFARIMAAHAYARRSVTSMEFNDYLQYARIGLIEAIDRFDPQREIKFETFAGPRVTGAILNGLESSSDLQQQVAARKRVMQKRAALLNEAGGAASDVQSDVFSRLAEIAIGLAVGFMLEGTGMHSAGEADYSDNTYRGVELKQLRQQIRAALLELSPRQRKIIESHYIQLVSFEELAEDLNVTRGRISQIHTEALNALRTVLQQRARIDLNC